MRTGLEGAELNHPAVDKQAYVVFKVVKQFRPYILKNRTKVIVPHLTVQTLFMQKELGERREEHIFHLRKKFYCCQKYGISLNTKKWVT